MIFKILLVDFYAGPTQMLSVSADDVCSGVASHASVNNDNSLYCHVFQVTLTY